MTVSAKLASLDAAMTPGPWEYYLVASTDGGPGEVLIGPDPDGPPWSREASYQAEDDARHIAALRNALPELTALAAAVEAGTSAIPLERLTCPCEFCVKTRSWFFTVPATLAALDAKLT
jgi:hypothetical protein